MKKQRDLLKLQNQKQVTSNSIGIRFNVIHLDGEFWGEIDRNQVKELLLTEGNCWVKSNKLESTLIIREAKSEEIYPLDYFVEIQDFTDLEWNLEMGA